MSSATKPVGEAQPTITCRALHNFSPSLPYTVASYPCTTDPNAGGYSPGCGSAAVEFWPTSPGCCWAGARSHRTVKDKASWMTGDWDCIDWRQNYHKQKKKLHIEVVSYTWLWELTSNMMKNLSRFLERCYHGCVMFFHTLTIVLALSFKRIGG